jgi:hypothetical protein
MRWARLDGKNSLWVALRDLSFSGHNWLTLTIGKLNWISTRSARGLGDVDICRSIIRHVLLGYVRSYRKSLARTTQSHAE